MVVLAPAFCGFDAAAVLSSGVPVVGAVFGVGRVDGEWNCCPADATLVELQAVPHPVTTAAESTEQLDPQQQQQ